MSNDGGPAFPNKVVLPRSTQSGSDGMTLRDWFAGQALGVAASSYGAMSMVPIVDDAYRLADLMLERRKR